MHSEPARRYVMALFRRRLRETAMACEGKRYISGMRRRVCEEERGSVSPREGVAGCVV
jgi:hypothetical protein